MENPSPCSSTFRLPSCRNELLFRQKKSSHVQKGSTERPGHDANYTSNLHRFMEHTTPTVPSQFLFKSRLRGSCFQESHIYKKNFFTLGDLWDSFDEWSAYGAGVPIVLNPKDTVVQYYVPYLSAIQLYSSEACKLYSKNRRHLGDDSDGSEVEYRDSGSETSSNDGEQLDHGSEGDSHDHRTESLLFEYFESVAPYMRVPLVDKIRDLSRQFPGIKTLCSNDLSQSSWLSVAWYPIYRIPTGVTLKDLSACFLTYHSLSTLYEESSTHQCKTQLSLYPFGIALYKFRGSVWTPPGATDRHDVLSLQMSSDNWLRRLRVRHPDYEYFMSKCPPASLMRF